MDVCCFPEQNGRSVEIVLKTAVYNCYCWNCVLVPAARYVDRLQGGLAERHPAI